MDNGQQALDALTARPFHCLLLDCQMPVKDGYEVARAVRAGAGINRGIVIIAVTANASTEDRRVCLQAGMDDYIGKPIRLKQLRAMLARWLPPPRAPADEASQSQGSRAG